MDFLKSNRDNIDAMHYELELPPVSKTGVNYGLEYKLLPLHLISTFCGSRSCTHQHEGKRQHYLRMQEAYPKGRCVEYIDPDETNTMTRGIWRDPSIPFVVHRKLMLWPAGVDQGNIPTMIKAGILCKCGSRCLQRCGGCRRKRYCSQRCLEDDWISHRVICGLSKKKFERIVHKDHDDYASKLFEIVMKAKDARKTRREKRRTRLFKKLYDSINVD